MKQAFAEHFFLFVLITIVHQVATRNNEANQRDSPQQRTFKAAVYEHAVILPTYRQTAVPRGVALENMMKNLLIYQQQAERAAAEGADIIVFPEDGLYGMSMTRVAMEPYLEYIPDPNVEKWSPCNDPGRHRDSEVQQFLSCLARNYSMYVVANVGDFQPCEATNSMCPKDEHYQYNTNVVYDRTGTMIAKYHKDNLFYEFQFDKPQSTEFVYFDTPFGRFGVFTCFDILFHDPAITLIEKYNVTNIAFPTAWMDALPLLAAIQFHSAYAAGLGVNFLSANIHLPEYRFHGSGIYTPDGGLSYYYSTEKKAGKLLISEVKTLKTTKIKNWNQRKYKHVKASQLEGIRNSGDTGTEMSISLKNQEEHLFQSSVFNDLFTFIALSSKSGSLEVCHNALCCHLEYEFADTNNFDYFAFGAFDNLHTYEGSYYLQICALLKCASDTTDSCGAVTIQSSTIFNKINIRGTFETDFIFPEILLVRNESVALAKPESWRYENNSLTFFDNESAVLSTALFGRVYNKYMYVHQNVSLNSSQRCNSCEVLLWFFLMLLNSVVTVITETP